MPVQSSKIITQSELDSLATLANTKLLPLVNASIAAGKWKGYFILDRTGIWYPANISPYGYYDIPGPVIFVGQVHEIQNPQPNYNLSMSGKWLKEFNRIRNDLWVLTFRQSSAGHPISVDNFLNKKILFSGPWVVGINDPDTYPINYGPAGIYGKFQGILSGSLGPAIINSFGVQSANYPFSGFTPDMPAFKNVKFCYAGDTDVTVNTQRYATSGGLTINGSVNFNWTANVAGTLTGFARVPFSGGDHVTVPSASIFSPTASIAGITFSTEKNTDSNVGNDFWLIATFDTSLAAGSGTITITTSAATGYSQSGSGQSALKLIFSTSTLVVPAQVLHPSSNGKMISCADIPDNSYFSINGNYGAICWEISDPTVKGIWIANTLPVPANNFFCDQDMPPYVKSLVPDAFNKFTVANGGHTSVNDGRPIASTKREVMDLTKPPVNGKAVSVPISPQATALKVLRDTDFVPFSYGFNTTESIEIATDSIAAGGRSNYSVSVPNGYETNWFAVKIRLVKSGTAGKGWKNGVFQYGDALGANLNIYVSHNQTPDPSNPATYDFITTNNEVNIPNDGGAGYPALINNGGFNFTVENPTANSMDYDVIIELDFSAMPVKQFFPIAHECFSYLPDMDNPPSVVDNFGPIRAFSKPIPQNGYCIFRIRASRKPVIGSNSISAIPAAGDVLTIRIGQNRLQDNGTLLFEPLMMDDGVTPFTVTIAAGAGDSGDINVFWPILGGNELIWQCDEVVVVEAFINWQPIWFSKLYSQWSRDGTGDDLNYSVGNFQWCLEFMNNYFETQSGYPFNKSRIGQNVPTITRWPFCSELYNETETWLGLI